MNLIDTPHIRNLCSARAALARFQALCLGMILAVAAWSCSGSESGDQPDAPGRDTDVYLTVEVDVAEPRPQDDAQSRAGYNEESDITYFKLPERECEKLQTLRVIIFNKKTGQVEANRQVRYKDGAIVMDNLTFKVKAGRKDIALFGNEMTLPADVRNQLAALTPGTAASAEDLKQIVWSGRPLLEGSGDYQYGANYQYATGASAVPMSELWEDIDVLEATTEDLRFQYVKLFITRAVTRFTFTLSKSPEVGEGNWGGLSNHVIKAFTIDRIGSSEYLLPNNTVYIPEKGIGSVYDNACRFIESFSVPASDNTPEPFTFTLSKPFDVDTPEEDCEKDKAGRTVMYAPYIYLPETPGPEFRCSITAVDKTTDRESTLFLPQVLPNLTSLPRNTHVIVNVLLTPGGLKCTVDVQPYTSVSLNPTFGFDELIERKPVYGEIPPWLEINPGEDDNYDPW